MSISHDVRPKFTVRSDSTTLLENLLESTLMTDITIKVSGRSFQAHRCILSAAIPYFAAMFTCNMRESTEDTVTIKEDIDPEIFELIIRYVYSHQINIELENVESLLATANFLQIENLITICADYLKNHLSLENALRVKFLAETVNNYDLAKSAEDIVLKHFTTISKSTEFLELPLYALREIISKIGFSTKLKNELIILTAISNWINHEPQSRRASLSKLLKAVRLHVLSPKELIEFFWETDFMKEDSKSLTMVMNALAYQLLPEKRHKMDQIFSELLIPIRAAGSRSIYIIGNGNQMERLNFTQNCWESVPSSCPRAMGTYAVLDGKLFVIGGLEMNSITNKVDFFDAANQCWAEVTPMITKRYDTSAVAMNGRIYVCGGSNERYTSLSSIEIYHPRRDRWICSSSMENSRCDFALVALDGRLYAIGGSHEKYTSVINWVEVFNPENQTWTPTGSMRIQRRSCGATVLEDKIYVCGGSNKMGPLNSAEVYDPRSKTWSLIAPMKQARVSPLVVAFGSKVYVIGGSDGCRSLQTVEIYDIKSNCWMDGPELRSPAGRTIGGVLNDPESFQDPDRDESELVKECIYMKL